MYLSHFDLQEKPFQITTDPKFIWLGEKHQEALSILKYGVLDNKGFLLLTGEVGTGKTVLINCLRTLVDVETVVAAIPDPDLDAIEFFNFLSDGFHMKTRRFERKGDFLLELRDFLYDAHARDQKVLLIVDEAQRLNDRLLEEIRLLSNIELHDRKLINIFFVGQNEFNSTLSRHQNRAVTQRITVRYNIDPLTETETGEYIQHRLKIAGTERRIFKSSALHEIFRFSGGVPRLINIVCDHAMLTGYALGKKTIDARIVKECAEELRIPVEIERGGDEQKLRETLESIRQEISDSIRNGTIGQPPANGVDPSATAAVQPAETRDVQAEGKDAAAASRPLWVKAAYLVIAALLLAVFGILLINYRAQDTQKWALEDLTPQKYRDSLDREGQSLKASLSGDQPAPPAPAGRKPSTPPDEGHDLRTALSAIAASAAGGEAGRVAADTGSPPSAASGSAATDARQPAVAESAATSNTTDFSDLKTLMAASGNKIVITFQLDSNDISPEAFLVLDRIAEFIAANPHTPIAIKGYTDSRGNIAYNKRISEFRATTIKSYLVGKGADPATIETFGLGPENPIADNETPEGREANRRVELEFDVEG